MRGVIDPELGSNLVELGMARSAQVSEDGEVLIKIALTTSGCPLRSQIQRDVKARLESLPGVTKVRILWDELTAEEKTAAMTTARFNVSQQAPDTAIPSTTKVLMVASGKGGVGKSTVAANLVLAMNMIGHDVGLLDADIHGPSIPIMMGARGKPASPDGKTIIPLTAHGIKFMSMGSLLPAEQAVIWRGPMLMGALQQMLQQVQWGALDVLVVDLPPGTGDVQLTLCQKFKPHGAVIVTTPQDVALADARRAVSMFRELKTPLLGLIENMSHFVCPHCGKETDLFGRSGARKEAEHQRIPFLGTIPMDAGIVQSGDRGEPAVLHNKDLARVFQRMAERLTQNGLGGA